MSGNGNGNGDGSTTGRRADGKKVFRMVLYTRYAPLIGNQGGGYETRQGGRERTVCIDCRILHLSRSILVHNNVRSRRGVRLLLQIVAR